MVLALFGDPQVDSLTWLEAEIARFGLDAAGVATKARQTSDQVARARRRNAIGLPERVLVLQALGATVEQLRAWFEGGQYSGRLRKCTACQRWAWVWKSREQRWANSPYCHLPCWPPRREKHTGWNDLQVLLLERCPTYADMVKATGRARWDFVNWYQRPGTNISEDLVAAVAAVLGLPPAEAAALAVHYRSEPVTMLDRSATLSAIALALPREARKKRAQIAGAGNKGKPRPAEAVAKGVATRRCLPVKDEETGELVRYRDVYAENGDKLRTRRGRALRAMISWVHHYRERQRLAASGWALRRRSASLAGCRAVLDALASGPKTVAALQEETGLPRVHGALIELRRAGLITGEPVAGARWYTYQRTSGEPPGQLAAPSPEKPAWRVISGWAERIARDVEKHPAGDGDPDHVSREAVLQWCKKYLRKEDLWAPGGRRPKDDRRDLIRKLLHEAQAGGREPDWHKHIPLRVVESEGGKWNNEDVYPADLQKIGAYLRREFLRVERRRSGKAV